MITDCAWRCAEVLVAFAGACTCRFRAGCDWVFGKDAVCAGSDKAPGINNDLAGRAFVLFRRSELVGGRRATEAPGASELVWAIVGSTSTVVTMGFRTADVSNPAGGFVAALPDCIAMGMFKVAGVATACFKAAVTSESQCPAAGVAEEDAEGDGEDDRGAGTLTGCTGKVSLPPNPLTSGDETAIAGVPGCRGFVALAGDGDACGTSSTVGSF